MDRDAWEAWKRQRHQLIISDWMMPCMDGLELCRRIRAEETSQLSYIILITAREGNANYLDAMNSGVDDFMSKPFERDRLHRASTCGHAHSRSESELAPG